MKKELLKTYGISKPFTNQKEKWNKLCKSEVLDEDFMKEYKDFINWNIVSSNQLMSESFIEEFKDKVNWEYICKSQELTESFI